MSKKIELRVQSQGEKCKSVILKTVAKVQGVTSMSLDYDKGIVTITGCVDVVEVVKQLRKANRPAEVVSVGPENPPEKPSEEPSEEPVEPQVNNNEGGDKHKCNCNKPLLCYCYYPQPSNYMPQPSDCPQVVFYDQPPYNNCTIC